MKEFLCSLLTIAYIMSDKLTLENFRKAFTITVLPEDEIFLGLPAVKGRQSLPPAPPPLVGIGQARRKV